MRSITSAPLENQQQPLQLPLPTKRLDARDQSPLTVDTLWNKRTNISYYLPSHWFNASAHTREIMTSMSSIGGSKLTIAALRRTTSRLSFLPCDN